MTRKEKDDSKKCETLRALVEATRKLRGFCCSQNEATEFLYTPEEMADAMTVIVRIVSSFHWERFFHWTQP